MHIGSQYAGFLDLSINFNRSNSQLSHMQPHKCKAPPPSRGSRSKVTQGQRHDGAWEMRGFKKILQL